MTADELLSEVKKRLGITGDYQDDTLRGHIEDVTAYMLDAGVPEKVMNEKKIVGAVTRGVSYLWNYGAGEGEFSSYFCQRVIQLTYSTQMEGE